MEANNLRRAGERAKHQDDSFIFFHVSDCFHTAAGQVEIGNRSLVDDSEGLTVFGRTVDVTFPRKRCGRHKKNLLCRKPLSQFFVDQLVDFTHRDKLAIRCSDKRHNGHSAGVAATRMRFESSRRLVVFARDHGEQSEVVYGREPRTSCQRSDSELLREVFTARRIPLRSLYSMPPRKKTAMTTEPRGVFAVIGSDEGETKRRAKELASELTPEFGADFGVDTIDGTADNAEQAVLRLRQTKDAIQTLPFFGGEKLVWLKNVNFLGDTATGRSAAVQEALEEFKAFLERGLPEGVQFLLSASEVDKRRSFYKSLGKFAKVEQFDRIDTSRPGWEAGCSSHRAPVGL